MLIKIGATKLSRKRLQQFSKKIREERGNKCECCGIESNETEVHHRLEKYIYPIFAFEPDNVIVLCKECHSLATQVQRTHPDFSNDFYSKMPINVQKRLNAFLERAKPFR
jgi:hypothetical protein